jgi:hypothetical protein
MCELLKEFNEEQPVPLSHEFIKMIMVNNLPERTGRNFR